MISRVQRRLVWLKRHREFRRAIEKAACGEVEWAPFPDEVAPPCLVITRGRALSDPELRVLLRDDELGSWAFDAATLALLKFLFERDEPPTVLEFGAGVSTLALALWMKSCWKDEQTRVYSVEQNSWQIEKTRERLRKNGLEQQVALFHAPLQSQTVFDVEGEFYDLSACLEQLRSACPHWILVDGPAGDDFTRFGSLAQLQQVAAPNATWFLDDATRDEERVIMEKWTQLPFLRVEGTYRVGKGLARGSFVTV